MEEEDGEKELTDLQREIDLQIEKDNSRRKKAAITPILGLLQFGYNFNYTKHFTLGQLEVFL